ncbi:MAG: penicillin-binding protein 1A [Calothrix sp. MO_167.B12]|nr:penicillin-binding protein 1A [Calothrix sp. MO_167.B12]
MAKITSWFKGISTKLNKHPQEKPGLTANDRQVNEKSAQKNLKPKKPSKGKQILKGIGGFSSGVMDKLPGKGKPLYRRYWLWAGLGVGGSIFAINYGISSLDKTLPDKAALNAVVREQTLTIKAADGKILQQQGEVTREQLKIEEIPYTLKQAFIASEDRRFREHGGVDPQGIARAVLNNLRSQTVVQGGSTITQQLARILFLKQERTILRKLKEARLAQKMEEELTKDEILERYLNLVYLGSGAYGVADAAWVYFSKKVNQLTLGEMATIAALPPAPNKFSPQVSIETATKRRNLVLQRMAEDKLITPTEQQKAIAEPITLKVSRPKRWEIEAPYFISYIQKELPKYVSAKALGGGLTVETSLNLEWQKAAEEAVARTLRNEGRWQRFKQAAIVAIDPSTGEIKAMVGGKDFDKNKFNRVTQAQRQPGSTFKGFVYAAAIASGKNPNDGYPDKPLIVDGYEPKNFDESFRGWISMRDAFTKSINTVAVRILLRIGFEPTIELAQKMGIQSELKPVYSLALGSNEVNLLELTSAYGTFATQGLHTAPHGIKKIFNRQGKVIWSADFKPKRALDKDSAAIMTWMLRRVVRSGTGTPANLPRRPVAGKTGTTDEARDLWFVGYIPQLVTGVWLGNDDNRKTSGSSASAAIAWRRFMRAVTKEMDVEKFPSLPKLRGRKGTIKAKPIKPKRLINRAIPKNKVRDGDAQEDSRNSNRRSRRRRRRRYQQSEENTVNRSTRRYRRRRSRVRDNSSSSTSSRSRRRRRRNVESNRSSGSSSSRSTTRRRVRTRTPQRRSAPVRVRKTTPPAPPKPKQRSWRERLRPSQPSN